MEPFMEPFFNNYSEVVLLWNILRPLSINWCLKYGRANFASS